MPTGTHKPPQDPVFSEQTRTLRPDSLNPSHCGCQPSTWTISRAIISCLATSWTQAAASGARSRPVHSKEPCDCFRLLLTTRCCCGQSGHAMTLTRRCPRMPLPSKRLAFRVCQLNFDLPEDGNSRPTSYGGASSDQLPRDLLGPKA